MSGWLVLKFDEDENGNQAEEKFKSAGETWLQIATPGYPTNFAFGSGGLVSAEWLEVEADQDEEGPELRGKSRAELAAEAETAAVEEPAEAAKATAKAK
jgi:hypothetical protein